MKNVWIWVIIIFIIVLGYFGRHQIRSMFSYPPQPTVQVTNTPTNLSPSPATTSNDIVMTKTDSIKGAYSTDSKGMTLYVFDKDMKGKSNCNGACAKLWPPYIISTPQQNLPTNISVIKRTDGTTQYAWKDMPLYYYSKDKQVGDVIGDGFNGVWHLAKP